MKVVTSLGKRYYTDLRLCEMNAGMVSFVSIRTNTSSAWAGDTLDRLALANAHPHAKPLDRNSNKLNNQYFTLKLLSLVRMRLSWSDSP